MKGNELKENARPRIGFACAYTPLALIDAAGYAPYRILPLGDCPDQAGHILHDNLCPHIKKILDRAMDGDLPELDGVIFMNSCDAMRRLYDAWQAARPDDRTILVDLPVTADATSVRFFTHELMRLVKTLEVWSGKPLSPAAILKGIRRTNEVAAAIAGIREKILSGQVKGGGQRLQTIYNHAATEPFERTLELISDAMQEKVQGKTNGGVPVYLFGNVMPDAEVFSLFESCGAIIAGEDLCTGSRLFSAIDESAAGDPLSSLAHGLLHRPPCARTIDTGNLSKMSEDILKNARACGARGIIGHAVKFCDPYIFRMPVLAAAFRNESFPLLTIEGDCTLRSLGQQRTRIEAFIEMLR